MPLYAEPVSHNAIASCVSRSLVAEATLTGVRIDEHNAVNFAVAISKVFPCFFILNNHWSGASYCAVMDIASFLSHISFDLVTPQYTYGVTDFQGLILQHLLYTIPILDQDVGDEIDGDASKAVWHFAVVYLQH